MLMREKEREKERQKDREVNFNFFNIGYLNRPCADFQTALVFSTIWYLNQFRPAFGLARVPTVLPKGD